MGVQVPPSPHGDIVELILKAAIALCFLLKTFSEGIWINYITYVILLKYGKDILLDIIYKMNEKIIKDTVDKEIKRMRAEAEVDALIRALKKKK